MSYSELYAFDIDGNPTSFKKYKNSHGWFSVIFGAMDRRYESTLGIKGWLFGEDDYWDKLNSCPFKWWEYNVVNFAYDKTIVMSDKLELLAISLEKFQKEYALPNHVSHLLEIANDLRQIANNKEFIAAGMYATSLSDNLWFEYKDLDEECPYNIKTNNNHTVLDIKSEND